MQQNVKNLQEIFPAAKIKTEGNQVKAHVSSITNKEFDHLADLRLFGNDVTAKRSGKGITVIVSPKG